MSITIGDTVEVVDSGQTYTNYDSWYGVACGHVSSFVDGAIPKNGATHTVTFIGKHGNGHTTLFVLDHKYIVNEEAIAYMGKRKGSPVIGCRYDVGNFERARASGWSTVCQHYHVDTK